MPAGSLRYAALALVLVAGSQPAEDREEILRIHRTDREAHFKTDADLLFSNTGDGFISVSNGRVSQPSLDALRARFREHFRGARYLAWDDLEPPRISISPDGTRAWAIVRVHVKRMKAEAGGVERLEESIYAGITTFEKRDGRWVKTSNVSTFEQ